MDLSTLQKTPEAEDFSDLEKTDLNVLFFRISFDLGLAVEEELTALGAARCVTRYRSLFHLICEKSENWADIHINKFARKSEYQYTEYVKAVRAFIEADSVAESECLSPVYIDIASNLREREPHELALALGKKCDIVYDVMTSVIYHYGGPLSKARWNNCKPAALVFKNNSGGHSMCSFERDSEYPDGVITIHIGDHIDRVNENYGLKDKRKGALRVYFVLEFSFFHEYLSHSFALWQRGYELVEGYLFWVAKEVFFKKRGTAKFVTKMVEEAFPFSADRARLAEEVARWYGNMLGDKFLTFLLEWSAALDWEEFSDLGDFVALELLSDLPTDEQSTSELRSAFDIQDPRATVNKLRGMANEMLRIRGFEEIKPYTRVVL